MTRAPLRVCFVAGNIYPLLAPSAGDPVVGGAEVQQLLLARELARRGVEIVWVTEDFGQGADTTLDGARVLAYTFGRDKLRQALTLWRALNRASAAVYYVRGAPKFLALLLLHSIGRNLPLVIGMSTNQMTHPRRSTGLNRPQHLAYRLALARASAVVAQTETQRALLRRNYGVRNAVVLPNGTPPALEPTEAPAASRRTTVIWLASLIPYKGVERVFELAALCPELSFEIHGAPERGATAYYEAMRARAAALPNVVWRGPLAREAVDAGLAGTLALINTTLPFQGVEELEGFPNVYLEAWRNGVPTLTLANDPDGVIERHGLGRRTVTVAAMAAELRELAADPPRRARIGAAARAQVERTHALPRVADAYLELFRRAAGRA